MMASRWSVVLASVGTNFDLLTVGGEIGSTDIRELSLWFLKVLERSECF